VRNTCPIYSLNVATLIANSFPPRDHSSQLSIEMSTKAILILLIDQYVTERLLEYEDAEGRTPGFTGLRPEKLCQPFQSRRLDSTHQDVDIPDRNDDLIRNNLLG
jgi:hypothetical protein